MSTDTPIAATPAATCAATAACDPIQLIADPGIALEAARRMEVSCRRGLRFFSDFRRVKSLDELDAIEVDGDVDAIDETFSAFDSGFDSGFDPGFVRRL